MISLRRVRIVLLAAPLLLAGCSSGDVIVGGGTTTVSPTSSAPVRSATPLPTRITSSGASSSGTGSGAPLARYSTLTGNGTGLSLDPSFVQALSTVKVTPGTVGTTKLSGRVISFPITGGNATLFGPGSPLTLVATVQHDGSGLSLSAGGVSVGLQNFVFQFGASSSVTGTVTANGKTVVTGARLFDLDTSSTRVANAGSDASVLAVGVRVGAELAALLNKSFQITAFRAGTEVGDASLTLSGR